MKITERTFDAQTGETVDIERELTKAEIAERKEGDARIQAMLNAQAEKAATKAALLERLGITADEAASLLG
jgi:DNA-binding protein H-NS